jgi:hypothetical protein
VSAFWHHNKYLRKDFFWLMAWGVSVSDGPTPLFQVCDETGHFDGKHVTEIRNVEDSYRCSCARRRALARIWGISALWTVVFRNEKVEAGITTVCLDLCMSALQSQFIVFCMIIFRGYIFQRCSTY